MSKETEASTPECDKHRREGLEEDGNFFDFVPFNFARQLERQRDEARKYLELKDIAMNAWQDESFRANVRSNQLEEELTTSKARLRELEQALVKFGFHQGGCLDYHFNGPCTCGWSALQAKLDQGK